MLVRALEPADDSGLVHPPVRSQAIPGELAAADRRGDRLGIHAQQGGDLSRCQDLQSRQGRGASGAAVGLGGTGTAATAGLGDAAIAAGAADAADADEAAARTDWALLRSAGGSGAPLPDRRAIASAPRMTTETVAPHVVSSDAAPCTNAARTASHPSASPGGSQADTRYRRFTSLWS